MNLLEEVRKYRIIAAIRGVEPEKMVDTVRAISDGGIHMVEITFNQADPQRHEKTAGAIAAVKKALGDRVLVGAGTVMSLEDLQAAYEAGASYMLSPNLDLAVLEKAKQLSMGAIPGAMTPTEVACAYQHGADLVKLFPCDCLGLGYIKALKAPVNQVPLLAMGGVNEHNLMEYLAMVDGVGIGSGITRKDLIQAEDYAGLTALARKYTSQLG